jgi:hypothetical protein
MKLYFKDTLMMYSEITEMLTTNIGPAGEYTWQNGAELTDTGFRGYVEIYSDTPGSTLVALAWSK